MRIDFTKEAVICFSPSGSVIEDAIDQLYEAVTALERLHKLGYTLSETEVKSGDVTFHLSLDFEEEEPQYKPEDLDLSIEALELTVQAYTCLKDAGIRTVREIVVKSDRELREIKNFTRTCLRAVKAVLLERGLSTSMDIEPLEPTDGQTSQE